MPSWFDKILSSQTVQFGLGGLAFLIALWLVIVIARMLMGGRLRLPGGRTRQARLGIVDAFDLDRQRQLIIVRRDNTEHLIMIGGPNDLVIESEIVRVEARDFRDTRRDKSIDGPGEARIPAPLGLPIPDALQGDGPPLAPRFEEPLLPMPLPQGVEIPSADSRNAGVQPSSQPQRPTFPFPPRRPVPPAPDRRPAPPLPDRASRTDDRPSAPGPADDLPPATLAPQQVPLRPVAPSVEASSGVAPTLSPDVSARPAPPVRPFLKPLPPRPPMRPLKRVTPQAEPPPSPAAAESGGASVAMPTLQPPPPPPPQEAITPEVHASPPAPPMPVPETAPTLPHPTDHPAEKDALDSLEEEMAKLLGRGS